MVVYLKSIENHYTGEVFTLSGMIKDKSSYYKFAYEYMKNHIAGLEFAIDKQNNQKTDYNEEIVKDYTNQLKKCEELLNKDDDGFDLINFYLNHTHLEYEGIEVIE